MTRWTPADVEAYQARTVGPTGVVNRHATPVVAKVSKRQRYGTKAGWFDGIYFGSHRELQRYKDLKLMEAAGAIIALQIHPRYELHVNGEALGYIEADFVYVDNATEKLVVEDVKSPTKNTSTRTPIYLWKRRHLKAEHGIDIVEITA